MREYCLDAMGLLQWSYRGGEAVPGCSFAFAPDRSWMVITDANLEDTAMHLFQAIASVLGIAQTAQQAVWDDLASHSTLAQHTRVLLLGEAVRTQWQASHLSGAYGDERVLCSHSLSAMLQDPNLKRDLWGQLRPLLGASA